MKKYILCGAIASLLLTTSCSDFLDVRAVGSVNQEDLLNQDGLDKVLTGMYSTLHNTAYFDCTLSNWSYGDVLGGSANKGSTYTDQAAFTSLETYSITTDNSFFIQKWASIYNGVFRANVVIDMANQIKNDLSALKGESKDYYTETVAQARFIRALWHFEGIKLFGAAIPYVGSEEYSSSVNPMVSNVDESGNYIYIWDKVVDDFRFAYENLPEVWTIDKGRANKWAAAGFLAKTLVYWSSAYNGKNGNENHWEEAKTLLAEIIAQGKDNNGTKYKLADSYEDLYVAGVSDWTGESVFDIPMAISGTQTNTNAINGPFTTAMVGSLGSGGWGFFQPSYELANSFIVDKNGLPYLDNSYQSMPALTTMVETVPKTDLGVYTDPRLDVTIGRFNVPYWDYSIPTILDGWVRDITNGGPYMNKKDIPKKADKGGLSLPTETASTAKNFHMIRFADILLWYAEALIETGQYKEAGKYINQVRSRAANHYVKAANPETMEESTSSYVLEDLVHGKVSTNAAANYRIGLYPDTQFNSKENATQALRFERKLELALEGHRWYDLARWGIVGSEIKNYINYEKQYLVKYARSYYESHWVTLPIPNSQILTMEGVLVQNENWK